MLAFTRVALGLLLGSLSIAVCAGEIVGSSFISEKDGVIEVAAEGWTIMDTEAAPPFPYVIARFTLRPPLKGMSPYADLFRLPNPGGQVTPEAMLQELRDSLGKQPNMTPAAIEARQFAGRRVLALPVTVKVPTANATVNGMIYMMQGERSLYWAQFFANATIWNDARAAFDRLMENVKY